MEIPFPFPGRNQNVTQNIVRKLLSLPVAKFCRRFHNERTTDRLRSDYTEYDCITFGLEAELVKVQCQLRGKSWRMSDRQTEFHFLLFVATLPQSSHDKIFRSERHCPQSPLSSLV